MFGRKQFTAAQILGGNECFGCKIGLLTTRSLTHVLSIKKLRVLHTAVSHSNPCVETNIVYVKIESQVYREFSKFEMDGKNNNLPLLPGFLIHVNKSCNKTKDKINNRSRFNCKKYLLICRNPRNTIICPNGVCAWMEVISLARRNVLLMTGLSMMERFLIHTYWIIVPFKPFFNCLFLPWYFCGQILCFTAYFRQHGVASEQIRKVKILYYMEDGTIQVIC